MIVSKLIMKHGRKPTQTHGQAITAKEAVTATDTGSVLHLDLAAATGSAPHHRMNLEAAGVPVGMEAAGELRSLIVLQRARGQQPPSGCLHQMACFRLLPPPATFINH